jgi:protein TonB
MKRPASGQADGGVPVPAKAVPRFTRPAHLMPNSFWSNLKQFLFERPVKIHGEYKSPLMPTHFGDGVASNLKEYFSSRPMPRGAVSSRFAVAWGSNFGGFGDRLREFFVPTKAAPLPAGIKPVKVKDIWSKDENFGWSQIIAFGVHGVLLFALLVVPIFISVSPSTEAKNKLDVTPLDISPYISKLPAGEKKAGGGGGANDHTTTPVNKGKLPKFKMTQFTPPQVKPVPDPKLAMDPSLLAPPDLKVANQNLPTFGDPLANANSDSLGHGSGTGIGSGDGGGLGPGSGGGTGGGAFRAGVNGVGSPVCIYCPQPEYSDEARKAKYQGAVTLDVLVTTDGRVLDPRVIKGPGLGLEEKAIAQVKNWKLKPAIGPSGKPVNARVIIEVTFRLF